MLTRFVSKSLSSLTENWRFLHFASRSTLQSITSNVDDFNVDRFSQNDFSDKKCSFISVSVSCLGATPKVSDRRPQVGYGVLKVGHGVLIGQILKRQFTRLQESNPEPLGWEPTLLTTDHYLGQVLGCARLDFYHRPLNLVFDSCWKKSAGIWFSKWTFLKFSVNML